MYNSIYKAWELKNFNKKKLKKTIKWGKLRTSIFFYRWNAQGQHRLSWNLTRSFLLNSKLWYFQKKNIITLPLNWKKNNLSITGMIDNTLILNSKIKWLY